MSFKLKATNFQAIAPGNTATLKISTGKDAPTLDGIVIQLSGTAVLPSHIERIIGKANGTIILDEGSGTLLNKRDDYRGIHTDNAFLTIDYTEPKARNGAVEQLLGSIPLSLLQNLTYEFKIAAGAPANIAMDAQIIVRQPTKNPYITKKLNTSQAFAASGTQIMYLPVGSSGGKMKRIWIHETTPGTITDLEIRVGNVVTYETNRAKLEHRQKVNGLVPQAGVVVVDFIEDGNLSGVLDTGMAANVELRLQSSAANGYTVYYEFIDPIGRM